VGHKYGITEVELVHDPGQIVHQGIQVIALAGRIRAAMPAAIRDDTPEAVRSESHYVAAPDI
jgi:hypothetical protein